MPDALQVTIRTPDAQVFQAEVRSVRVPSDSGWVGLRPGGEPLVLAVDPWLIVMHDAVGPYFAATAGGLLRSDRAHCTLLTPYAAVGRSEQEMEDTLSQLRNAPTAELLARRRLEELEQRVMSELTQHQYAVAGRHDGD